jgi:hypothetical protein
MIGSMSDGEVPLRAKDLLIAELRELAMSEGAVVGRITADRTPTLLALGEAWKSQDSSWAEGRQPLGDCALGLIHAARQGMGDESREALDVELGIEIRGPSKTARRRVYQNHNPKGASPATLKRRFEKALPDLAGRIIDLADSLKIADIGAPTATSNSHSDQPYLIDEVVNRYRVKDGKAESLLVSVTIIALRAGQFNYLSHHAYFTDGSPDALTIKGLFGCSTLGEPFNERGVTFQYLRMSSKLALNERHTLLYRVDVNTDAELDPILMTTPDTDVPKFSLEVEFANNIPARYWTFHNLPYLQPDRRQIEKKCNGSFIKESWTALVTGLTTGVTWERAS